MVDLVTLADARRQVKLEDDDDSEDSSLSIYLAAAKRACSAVFGFDVATSITLTSDDRDLIRLAMLMAVASWYRDRDAGELPAAALSLLGMIRPRSM